MGSLGVPGGAANFPRLKSKTLDKKKRQFLANPAWT
jgi:hypothetical protein